MPKFTRKPKKQGHYVFVDTKQFETAMQELLNRYSVVGLSKQLACHYTTVYRWWRGEADQTAIDMDTGKKVLTTRIHSDLLHRILALHKKVTKQEATITTINAKKDN